MLAIIPARGGSKGLPGKNIKLLNGKPLIAHTIHEAKKAKSIDRIIVTTDDEEIAAIAIGNGAECPFLRPSSLATDDARALDVYKHVLSILDKESFISEFVVLQPTSPLRKSLHIDEAVALFKNKEADSVVSYCEEHHPVKWHKYLNENGQLESIFEETLNNRQDERPTYFPNGAIYVFKRKLIERGTYYSGNSYPYIMDRRSSVDIDTIDDFYYAQTILELEK